MYPPSIDVQGWIYESKKARTTTINTITKSNVTYITHPLFTLGRQTSKIVFFIISNNKLQKAFDQIISQNWLHYNSIERAFDNED